MLIEKLDIVSDASKIYKDLSEILKITEWPKKNQIGLKHRNGASNIWTDAEGSLINRNIGFETDFVNWSIDSNYYVRQEIEKLCDMLQIETGRIRFMKLLPKVGLTLHRDTEARYHIVLKTNPSAHFGFTNEPIHHEQSSLPAVGSVFHMPKDNHWYRVDTTKLHWVFNGGNEERIHLVVCETPKK